MRLRIFAGVLERVEGSASRRAVVDALAELLGRADRGSIEAVVRLLQGQLRPAHEGVEIGVATKLLIRILAETYRKSTTVVARRFKRTGDLGLLAQSLAPATRRARLTVLEAYRSLLAVSGVTGSGSIDRKVALLVRLLRKATAVEAKYLVRIVQGRLRLGVGDQTLLEAAAVAALGDGRKKRVLEHAYNVRSDLAQVVRLAFTRGERALARIAPSPGIPVRPALAQRLRSPEEIIARLGLVQAEPKYDGFRLQLHRQGVRVQAFSRRLEDVTAMFPELTDGLRRQLRARRAIIEGEAVVYDPVSGEFLPFQVTMTRKRKTGIAGAAERHPLRLFAFDLLYADGRNYIPRPQRERSRRLRALLPHAPGDPLAVTEYLETDRPRELRAYFDEMLHRGLEGIVAKRPEAPYHAGARDYTWVKLKRAYQRTLQDTVDVVLVGYFAGRGKRAALGIGSLLGAVYDPGQDRFRTVAKIGSGPSDREWRELRALLDKEARTSRPRRVESRITPDVWVEPRYVVEVLADEVTRSPLHTCGRSAEGPGYALRFPRMLNGVRTDKAAEDATTEREILDLSAMRRGPIPAAPAAWPRVPRGPTPTTGAGARRSARMAGRRRG